MFAVELASVSGGLKAQLKALNSRTEVLAEQEVGRALKCLEGRALKSCVLEQCP
jgi:hypothetical protein